MRKLSFSRAVALSVALLIVATLSLTAIGSDTAHGQINFEPQAIVTVDDPTPGANSNILGTFCVDFTASCALAQPAADLDSSNFGATVAFTPKEFVVPAGEGGGVDIGAFVIHLSSQATLGVLNGPCQPTGLTPAFNMLNATTNVDGAQVQYLDDDDPGILGEIFEDDDSNGLPNGVEMFPDFVFRIFQGAKPYARYYGQTTVVGVDVALNFVVFEPGAAINTSLGSFQTDPAMGYPSVTILQNVGDPEAQALEGNAITDFCSPLKAVTETFGTTENNPTTNEGGGATFRTNPPADTTVNFVQFATSQRDADDDGFENGFDTCPFDPNVENARLGGLEGDGESTEPDGIDSACDPDPTGTCGPGLTGNASDCDADQFPNRGDNCPLIAQDGNLDDGDNDGIGDACDPNPDTPDGEINVLCIVNAIDIGAGGEAGSAPASDDYLCTTSGACIDAAGDDGVCDYAEGIPFGGSGTDDDGTDDGADGGTNGGTTDGGTTGGTDTEGGAGGPATGVGSLAPAAASIPAWATILAGLGSAGVLGSLGAMASRIFRRRE
ncbi:MAG: hypothetical protein WD379_09380 [Dehalococcoidia bacterium]